MNKYLERGLKRQSFAKFSIIKKYPGKYIIYLHMPYLFFYALYNVHKEN